MTGSFLQTWQVELQCPQCGAPLLMEETDRLLSCSFCRVRLVIHCPGHCRYYLPAANEARDTEEDLLIFIEVPSLPVVAPRAGAWIETGSPS